MEQRIILAIYTLLLTVVTQTEAKIYRKDYVYNWRTDAFYKLHVDSDSPLKRSEVCELEGAKLMSTMSEQELSRVHSDMNQYLPSTEEDGDWQQHDAADDQHIIDDSDAQDVLEMSCRVTTRDGHVETNSVFRNMPCFICKVEAKDVSYNSQCRVHFKGYRFVSSVGSCYKLPRVALTWHQAAAECQAEGAHLAVINSEQEARELKTLTNSVADLPESSENPFFFIGFRSVKVTEPRVFKTIFNETLEAAGFSTWLNGEPNNAHNGQESCGSIYRNEGNLNDIRCFARYAFICEKEVIPNCRH